MIQCYNAVSWLITQSTVLKRKLYKKLADRLKSVDLKSSKVLCYTQDTQKKNNQGRRVINLVNCHTSEISYFVDLSWEKFHHIINFPLPPNSLLVTMNVKSLFKSICINEGIAWIKVPVICEYLQDRIQRKVNLSSNQKQMCNIFCYKDNMFMVWIKSEKELRQFIRQIHVLFLSYKYCNKWITTRDNDNVQSRDQEESKLNDTITTNSGAHLHLAK